jgi:hypothetical protein
MLHCIINMTCQTTILASKGVMSCIMMILWDVNGMLMYDILQKLVLRYRSGPPYLAPTLHSNAPILVHTKLAPTYLPIFF